MAVLVVEDDPAMRWLLSQVLSMEGHRVESVTTAEMAWERCLEAAFPLIVLDWQLPGMDGLELCRRLRRLAREPTPFVLMVSVRDDPGDAEEAAAAGVDDYLVKPFDLDELTHHLKAAERFAERGHEAGPPTPG